MTEGTEDVLKLSGVPSITLPRDKDKVIEVNIKGTDVVIGSVRLITDADKVTVTPVSEDGSPVEQEVKVLSFIRVISHPMDTWRNNDAMITSLLRQNDVGDVVWT